MVERLAGTLETHLHRDSGLSHYEYFTLAMLSEAPDRTLRMTALAAHTNATLARLSHVVPGSSSAASSVAIRARKTDEPRTRASPRRAGTTVVAAAPGHVETVLPTVVDPLSAEQVGELDRMMGRILERLDPAHVMVEPSTTDD